MGIDFRPSYRDDPHRHAYTFNLSRHAIERFRRMYEGTLPAPAQVKRAETLFYVLRDIARVVILALGGMMILSEVGVDLKPLLAAAGLGGLAIGFERKVSSKTSSPDFSSCSKTPSASEMS